MRYIYFKILFSFLLCVSQFTVHSQQSVSHPLSSYGIGDYQLFDHGIYSALGNIQVPFLDSSQLNYFNPATYGGLSKGNTLYSVGVNQRISFYSQEGAKNTRPTGNLNHIALAFKLKNHFGMAFGLKPLAAKGYYLSERIFTGLDSIQNTYTGNGYINNLFLGFAYAPIHNKDTYIGLGFNAGYLFGNVKNERTSQLIQGTSSSGGIMQESIHMNALTADFGFSAMQRLGKWGQLRIGATWQPTMGLNSTYESAFYSATNLNNPSSYDTLFTLSSEGKVIQGQAYSIGLAHKIYLKDRKRKNKTLHPELNVAFQFNQREKYSYSFNGFNDDSLFSQYPTAKRYSVGLEFRPERFLHENMATLGFFDKFTYRMGAYYGQLPYFDAQQNMFKEQALSLGIGIPVLAQQTLSSINFSVMWGQRGTFASNALKEDFLVIQLGTILSPASFERWFRKRKMD